MKTYFKLLELLLLLTQPVLAQSWKVGSGAPSNNWFCVASSADGMKLVAGENVGGLWTSTNRGATWQQAGAPITSWYAVASSDDGTNLAAAPYFGRAIYASTNSGLTWVSNSLPVTADTPSLVFSGNAGNKGKNLTALLHPNSGSYSQVYASTNYGASWQLQTIYDPFFAELPVYWGRLAISAGETNRLMSGYVWNQSSGGPVYFSTNSGLFWRKSSLPNKAWSAVAVSTNGTRMVAVAGTLVTVVGTNLSRDFGVIYTSTNSGMTWVSNNVPVASWVSVACSAEGSNIVALAQNGLVCASTNWGITWATNGMGPVWSMVAGSQDANKLAAIGGSSVLTSTNAGVTWTTNLLGAAWVSTASSSDCNKLVAASETGWIYVSTNSGIFWRPASAPTSRWSSVAASANGSNFVAVSRDGVISVSTNAGVSWASTNLLSMEWKAVACAANGSILAAAPAFGQIYISSNYGVSWSASGSPNDYWTSIASSADGARLVATPAFGRMYISSDFGASWLVSPSPNRSWAFVASSADGSKLVAGDYSILYTSADYGVTWVSNKLKPSYIKMAAVSTNGMNLAVAEMTGGAIYRSSDFGTNWITNNAPFSCYAVASCGDGSKLVVSPYSGPIYTWQAIPALNNNPAIGNLLVSWPSTAAAVGYALQTNGNLSTTNWLNASWPVTDDGTNKSVTLSKPATNLFFRLRSP